MGVGDVGVGERGEWVCVGVGVSPYVCMVEWVSAYVCAARKLICDPSRWGRKYGAFSLHLQEFFCTPKLTLISWVKVGRAVNFIYCVNVPAPPNFYQTEYKNCCTIKVKMYRKRNTDSVSKRYETDSVICFIKKIAMRKVNTLIYSN